MSIFHRYDGAAEGSTLRRMPTESFQTTTAPRTLIELMLRLEEFVNNEKAIRAQYPWAERFVMGYPLPEWQRPMVWTPLQKVRFITSLWARIDVGSYLVNAWVEFEHGTTNKPLVYQKYSEVLLDGQQRLSALQEYFLSQFPVPDKDGIPTYWNELSKVERRLFGNQTFSRATIESHDEATLRKIYDLHAFGGTPHTPEQRASCD